MKNVFVRKIRNFVVGVLYLLILGGFFSLYQNLVPYFLDSSPTTISCEEFYINPIENRWLSLEKCEFDYTKIFIKSIYYKRAKLTESLLLGLKPVGSESGKIFEPIALEIEDAKLVEEYKKASESEISLFQFIVKNMSDIYTGIVKDRSSIKEGDEKIFYYGFKVGKKPEFPSRSIQFFMTCVLLLILIYTIERRIFKNKENSDNRSE